MSTSVKLCHINQMHDREALALSNSFQLGRLSLLNEQYSQLNALSKQELLCCVEDCKQTLEKRFAAGQLLAYLGDPRINTFNPVMKKVPGNRVTIGRSESSIDQALNQYKEVGVQRHWLLKEVPAFQVQIEPFAMMKYPVSNQDYLQFLLDTQGTDLPSSWPFGMYPSAYANHPVYSVSIHDAKHYANWLSQKTGRCFRLPTEFEWEYAASGIAHHEYPWGNHYQRHAANTLEEKIYTTTPVGIFPMGNSPFDIADMAGNVEEYTSSRYTPYPNGCEIKDDLGGTGDYYVARGGSFLRYGDLARCSRRHGFYPKPIYAMGFRLVENNSNV